MASMSSTKSVVDPVVGSITLVLPNHVARLSQLPVQIPLSISIGMESTSLKACTISDLFLYEALTSHHCSLLGIRKKPD